MEFHKDQNFVSGLNYPDLNIRLLLEMNDVIHKADRTFRGAQRHLISEMHLIYKRLYCEWLHYKYDYSAEEITKLYEQVLESASSTSLIAKIKSFFQSKEDAKLPESISYEDFELLTKSINVYSDGNHQVDYKLHAGEVEYGLKYPLTVEEINHIFSPHMTVSK